MITHLLCSSAARAREVAHCSSSKRRRRRRVDMPLANDSLSTSSLFSSASNPPKNKNKTHTDPASPSATNSHADLSPSSTTNNNGKPAPFSPGAAVRALLERERAADIAALVAAARVPDGPPPQEQQAQSSSSASSARLTVRAAALAAENDARRERAASLAATVDELEAALQGLCNGLIEELEHFPD